MPQASLRGYFLNHYKSGGAFEHDAYEYNADEWCWIHKSSGIKALLWCGRMPWTLPSPVERAKSNACPKANAWWGQGVYSVRRAPDEWPDVATLIDNNYRNMHKRDVESKGHEAADEESVPFLGCDAVQMPPPKDWALSTTKRFWHLSGRAAEAPDPGRLRAPMGGPEHRVTLIAVNNLAFVLQNLGRFSEAEALHRRSLAGKEAQLGANHPSTLTSMSNLAVLLREQGKFDEARAESLWGEDEAKLHDAAEGLHRRALAGREDQLGSTHPDTLRSVSNLAALLKAKGSFAEARASQPKPYTRELWKAEGLHRRALAGREDQLGSTHPDTLSSVWNLAALLEAKGSFAEAASQCVISPGPEWPPPATHHVQAGQLYLRELRGMEAAGSEGMVDGHLVAFDGS
eukprot:s1011_g26.t1